MTDKIEDDIFINEFNMTSPKHLGVNNLHLFTIKGNIKKYTNISAILKEWASIRLIYYKKRIDYLLKTMEDEFMILSAKIRFIIDVIEGQILIMNRKMKDVEEQLEKLNYYKYENGYNYLVQMPISQLTMEKKEMLEREGQKLKNEIERLKNKSLIEIWEEELLELKEGWKNHSIEILEDYENDLKGEIKGKRGKGKK